MSCCETSPDVFLHDHPGVQPFDGLAQTRLQRIARLYTKYKAPCKPPVLILAKTDKVLPGAAAMDGCALLLGPTVNKMKPETMHWCKALELAKPDKSKTPLLTIVGRMGWDGADRLSQGRALVSQPGLLMPPRPCSHARGLDYSFHRYPIGVLPFTSSPRLALHTLH